MAVCCLATLYYGCVGDERGMTHELHLMHEGVDGSCFWCEFTVVTDWHRSCDYKFVRKIQVKEGGERQTVGSIAVPFAACVDEEDTI